MNVDAWLDTIEPRQFDEWMAYERIEPDETERLREIVKLCFAALLRSPWCGMDVSPDELDPMAKKEKMPIVTPMQAAAMVRLHYGA